MAGMDPVGPALRAASGWLPLGPIPAPDPMNVSASSSQPRDDGQAIHLGPERAAQRLVLLHGWGADADDLLDLAEVLVPPEVSVVSLRAPELHPAGMGRQWYPLLWSAAMVPEPAWEQVPAAREALRRRLLDLAATVPLERTAVLGFSQGAAMALDAATGGDQPLPLAALIASSGYPHRGWRPQGQRHTGAAHPWAPGSGGRAGPLRQPGAAAPPGRDRRDPP